MGDEKWIRRKPGRASGTVVPPPAGEATPAPPSLPQRRPGGHWRFEGRGRARQEREEFGAAAVPPGQDRGGFQGVVAPGQHRGGSREVVPPNSDSPQHGQAVAASPELPDNVRVLFHPVLPPRPASQGSAHHPGGASRLTAAAAERVGPSSPDPVAEAVRGHVRALEPGDRGGGQGQPAGRRPRRNAFLAGYRRQVAWMTALTVLLLATAAGTAVALVRLAGTGAAGQPGSRTKCRAGHRGPGQGGRRPLRRRPVGGHCRQPQRHHRLRHRDVRRSAARRSCPGRSARAPAERA